MAPIFLAHGALGVFDELIFVGVAVVFLVMMAVSWIRSRNDAGPAEPPAAPPESDATTSDDHFRLR